MQPPFVRLGQKLPAATAFPPPFGARTSLRPRPLPGDVNPHLPDGVVVWDHNDQNFCWILWTFAHSVEAKLMAADFVHRLASYFFKVSWSGSGLVLFRRTTKLCFLTSIFRGLAVRSGKYPQSNSGLYHSLNNMDIERVAVELSGLDFPSKLSNNLRFLRAAFNWSGWTMSNKSFKPPPNSFTTKEKYYFQPYEMISGILNNLSELIRETRIVSPASAGRWLAESMLYILESELAITRRST